MISSAILMVALYIGSSDSLSSAHEKMRRSSSSGQSGTVFGVVTLSPEFGDLVMGEIEGGIEGKRLPQDDLGDSEVLTSDSLAEELSGSV